MQCAHTLMFIKDCDSIEILWFPPHLLSHLVCLNNVCLSLDQQMMGTTSVNASLNLITIVPDLTEEEDHRVADAVNVMIEGGLRASLIGRSEEDSSPPSYGTFHSDSQDSQDKVRKYTFSRMIEKPLFIKVGKLEKFWSLLSKLAFQFDITFGVGAVPLLRNR